MSGCLPRPGRGRWLVILDQGDQYILGEVTPVSLGRWQRTASGRQGPGAPLAQRNALLCAFLDTCDFPRFEWSLRGTERWLLVEDVKWWLERPYRPLTFRARIDASGTPRDAVQSRMTERSSVAHAIERFPAVAAERHTASR